MKPSASLRLRLTAVILLPLLLIASLIGLWVVWDAQDRASIRFERGLLSAALAVSRDVAVSGGDALTPGTNALLRDTSGGPVFYHVYAPDGVFVTGYATPPVPISDDTLRADEGQHVFNGVHQSRPVRALRFIDTMQAGGLTGEFTVTVWQDQSVLHASMRANSGRVLGVIGLLLASVALVVWFGVHVGLRPLLDLEHAIDQRSGGDLSPIKRAVPVEVGGIVATLNRLFGQVSQAMTSQSDFIANAAHQLRNPIAGVLSLAEAVASANSPEQVKTRTQDLLDAARDTSELSQKLLMLERAEALTPQSAFERIDLAEQLPIWTARHQSDVPDGVTMACDVDSAPIILDADRTMLREAVVGLIDNAVRHGGSGLSHITLGARKSGDRIALSVSDDGQGIDPHQIDRAKERFVQLSESQSSGLGLSIVQAIAKGHGGQLDLNARDLGLCATLWLASSSNA